MAVWLLMSGHYTVLVTGLGVASVLFCTVMARRINADDEEGLPLFLMPRLPLYILWLMREIIISNLDTARVILFGKPDPVVFRVPATQTTAAGITTYANSITLTPGTVTMDIDDDGFVVHALNEVMADGVRSGEMDSRVTAIEGGQG
ncbi:MAG: Na+/H+ antiporter subunit E [Candidatus Puniceispirillales bacterium]